MSWAETLMLQETQRERSFNTMYVLEVSQTWTSPKSAYYKIICIGAGGNSVYYYQQGVGYRKAYGGGGGVAIKTKAMQKGETLTVTIGGSASCDGMTATSGGNGEANNKGSSNGSGGTANGGDENYTGLNGGGGNGGSVGCMIAGLAMSRDTLMGASNSGYGIYGHGGGGGVFADSTMQAITPSQPAAVIIIPLESI